MTDHKALRLVDVLRDQRQCDEDGVMCIVSRQAVDEAVQIIESMTAAPAASEGEDGAVAISYLRQVFDGKYVQTRCLDIADFHHHDADGVLVPGPHPDWKPAGFPYASPVAQTAETPSDGTEWFAGVLASAGEVVPLDGPSVAATPKHDEGREAAEVERMRGWAQGLIVQLPGTHGGRNSWLLNHGVGEEANWLRAEHARQRKAWDGWRYGDPTPEMRHYPGAALATQPAARRVTDEDVTRALELFYLSGQDNERSMRAALESFAQPAEGVSGG